ncbi:MAG: PilZ domain-containing protein [Acidobacteriia bacterium]|nr:PilZ domain-containing protein [Terriglobia bacterium]
MSEVARRQSERQPTRFPIRLTVDPEGKRIEGPALITNITQRGVGVRTRVALVPGQTVDIVPAEGAVHMVRSRVAWANPQASGEGSQAGLEFLTPLGGGALG